MEAATDLFDRLTLTDETTRLEVKRGTGVDASVLETVCAFANEPGLGGGYLLLGIDEGMQDGQPAYTVAGIADPDKLQRDLASQCATVFDQVVRPELAVELLHGRPVLVVRVPELPDGQKPLYFKKDGLPRGAYRRIGSTDQRCTADDLVAFYGSRESFDSLPVRGSSWADVDEAALTLYRTLRERANATAEELTYAPEELLAALGGITPAGELTYAGLLLFGHRRSLRRLLPMLRVDYIRVPGTEWIADPDNRFTTTDMRGPLLELVGRVVSAVADDLPRGFLLPEGQVQAESVGLPGRVLREAVVNALMHRSYRRHNEPMQVIRYNNRIELRNPGYSLKPEDELGEPGSRPRNPLVAAVLHDTNLAETKGSGIRTMRRLLAETGLAPPTFESNHGSDQFTARLLLHHFLDEADLRWLAQLAAHNLSDSQKRALIFLREVGAVDNLVFRQLNGGTALLAGTELRALRDAGLTQQQGRGRATYYVAGETLRPLLGRQPVEPSTQAASQTAPPTGESILPPAANMPTPPGLSANLSALPDNPTALIYQPALLPVELQQRIAALGRRTRNRAELTELLLAVCRLAPRTLREMEAVLGRDGRYLYQDFVQPLMQQGHLRYTIPDMPNHPAQAYTAAPETEAPAAAPAPNLPA